MTVNHSKSVLTPCTSIEYLGFIFHAWGYISVTPARFSKLHGMATKLLHLHNSCRRFVPFKLLRQFLGVVVSCYEAVPSARIYTHHLFAC